MASDGSDADGNTPKTPSKKTPKRANNRQIVRWNDEKLAYAFAEFRLAAQRHRIDIKKALDDAAKTIAPFVTGDALIQQLTKRRTRYIRELGENEATRAPVQSEKKPASRKRGFHLKAEFSDDNQSSPMGETPSSSLKRTPRSANRGSILKIKEEAEVDVPNPDETDPESEYTESPIKAKNKRVRAKKGSSTKKKKSQPKAQESWSDDEDEYVDEAGGVNTYIDQPSSPQSLSAETPSNLTKSGHHKRQGSFRGLATEHAETIYGDTYGIQHGGKQQSIPNDNVLQPAVEVAGQLSFYGQDVDVSHYGALNLGYPSFKNDVTHAQLQQMNEQLQAMTQDIPNHGIALPAPVHHSANTTNTTDIFSPMNHNFHPDFHGNALTNGYTMDGNNTTHIAPHSPGTDSSSPHLAVQSSPSPVHNDTVSTHKIGSFSSTDTVHSLSTNNTQLPVSFAHSAQGDEQFTFGRVDSPGFEQFGGLINQDHDSFGFSDGDRPTGDGEDDTAAHHSLMARQSWGWRGY